MAHGGSVDELSRDHLLGFFLCAFFAMRVYPPPSPVGVPCRLFLQVSGGVMPPVSVVVAHVMVRLGAPWDWRVGVL